MTADELREKLAAIEHQRWADWQRYVHSKLVGRVIDRPTNAEFLLLPRDVFQRWQRQMATPYAELSEAEKASDMEQVDRYWPLIEAYVEEQRFEAVVAAKYARAQAIEKLNQEQT